LGQAVFYLDNYNAMHGDFESDVWECILGTMNALEIARVRSICHAVRRARPALRLPLSSVALFGSLTAWHPDEEVIIYCDLRDLPFRDVSFADLRKTIYVSEPRVVVVLNSLFCRTFYGCRLVACAICLYEKEHGCAFERCVDVFWNSPRHVVEALVLSRL
jgi:hypothetical protein